MVVGQDLGITLDMETWQMKAHARGIRQRTDVVVLDSRAGAAGPGGSLVLELLHHPTGTALQLDVRLGGVRRAASNPRTRSGTPWQAPPFEVHRVGDCLRTAPGTRRGHRGRAGRSGAMNSHRTGPADGTQIPPSCPARHPGRDPCPGRRTAAGCGRRSYPRRAARCSSSATAPLRPRAAATAATGVWWCDTGRGLRPGGWPSGWRRGRPRPAAGAARDGGRA